MLELQLDHGFAREDASSKKSAIGSCSQAKSPTSAQAFASNLIDVVAKNGLMPRTLATQSDVYIKLRMSELDRCF